MSELDNMDEREQDWEEAKLVAGTEPMVTADSEMVDIDLPEDVQKVLFFALDEASKKLEEGEEVVPFTMVLAGDDVFMDEHPGEEVEDCFAMARSSVNVIAHLASAYVFCYDGFIELDDGTHDMLITEVGQKGEDKAVAYGLMYVIDEEAGTIDFDEGMLTLGEAETLFDANLVADAALIEEAYANLPEEDAE